MTEQDAPFWYSTSNNGTQITGSSQKLNDTTLKSINIIKTFINKLHTELIF